MTGATWGELARVSRAVVAAWAALLALALAACIYPFPSQEQHYYGAEECPSESEQVEARAAPAQG